MTKRRTLSTDETDFHNMMFAQDSVLANWVLGKLLDGKDPRDVAYLLDYYARHAQGWCTGRFGGSHG